MVIGFLYLIFVPGIVILRLVSVETLDISEKVLFSVGLSIAFLMFTGLAINELGKLAFGNPLSLDLLFFCINIALLLFTFGGNTSRNLKFAHLEKSKISKYLLSVLLSICLLLLGSYGIFLVNYSGNTLFILILILAISIIISLVFLKDKIIPSRYYPFLLLIIFICLLLFVSSAGYALVTPYITWLGDQWNEFYTFRLTGHFWDHMFYVPTVTTVSTYSMLSVTVLPVIFSTITGMDDSLLFKLLFPVVASFTAIGAYKLYQTQTDNKTAFLATFFLITIAASKGMGSSKQQIAELFYVLLFLLLLKKDFPPLKRNILLIIFGAALAISHYSLSYIFLFTTVALILILVLSKYKEGGKLQTFEIKSFFSFSLFFSTVAFSWYIFLNKSVIFNNLCEAIRTVIDDLDQFFNPMSRGTALQGLGFVETPTIFHKISSALFILTEIMLFFGFIQLLRSKKNSNFSVNYKIFATLNMGIIAINILLPRIADTFLMERFYQTSLIILAPLAVMGGKAVSEFVFRHRFQRLYVIFLVFSIFIPLFLFQTGFVYELTNSPSWSVSLCKHSTSQVELYRKFGCIDIYYVSGTEWLSNSISSEYALVYADKQAIGCELMAYTMIYTEGYAKPLSNVTQLKHGDFVYLNPSNTIGGTVFGEKYAWNISDIHFLHHLNKIYSNGGTEIYNNYY
jgi:uncharacterized membrane protein